MALTERGETTIAELFPRFNDFERSMTDGLTNDEKAELARLLRLVITNASNPAG